MPVTVERLPQKPIILVTYSGHVTVDDLRSTFTKSAAFITPSDGVLYRVVYIGEIEVDFVEVLHFAQTAAEHTPGTTTDSRFHVVIVGHDKWTKLFVQLMGQKQFGGIPLPCFVTLDQAMAYVEADQIMSR